MFSRFYQLVKRIYPCFHVPTYLNENMYLRITSSLFNDTDWIMNIIFLLTYHQITKIHARFTRYPNFQEHTYQRTYLPTYLSSHLHNFPSTYLFIPSIFFMACSLMHLAGFLKTN